MDGSSRREDIVKRFENAISPIPAKELAKLHGVSRQIIVQDIALLRASGFSIISTNRGYLLNSPNKTSCLIKTFHTEAQLEDELFTVVDLGGEVLNVIVNHRVYGRMEAELNISSRRDVRRFIEDITKGRSSPLMNITSNYHFHLIKAPGQEILNEIIEALKKKGYLIEIMEGQKLWKNNV